MAHTAFEVSLYVLLFVSVLRRPQFSHPGTFFTKLNIALPIKGHVLDGARHRRTRLG